MPLSALIREAAAHGLGGLEHLAGIPATVGGALATNARTAEGSLMEHVRRLFRTCIRRDARRIPAELDADRHGTHVRSAGGSGRRRLPASARAALGPAVQKNLRQRMKTWKDTQPFALASAGYIWKNPPGDRAARLIEIVGLRGKRVHGAEISSKCGNLIINRGGATHADILALMEMARERVEARMGVTLQPEIRLLGRGVATAFETQTLELSATR